MLTEKQIADLHLKDEILPALRAALKPLQIRDIYLRPKQDWDGDPLLHVYMNCEGKRRGNQPIRGVALRVIHDILQRYDDDVFPVVTVMDPDDFAEGEEQKFYAFG